MTDKPIQDLIDDLDAEAAKELAGRTQLAQQITDDLRGSADEKAAFELWAAAFKETHGRDPVVVDAWQAATVMGAMKAHARAALVANAPVTMLALETAEKCEHAGTHTIYPKTGSELDALRFLFNHAATTIRTLVEQLKTGAE